MRESFRQELRDLKMETLLIGRLVIMQTRGAVDAVVSQDVDLAEKVIAGDAEIDRRTRGVEDHSIEVIATQYPVARDLRLLMSLSYMTMHMERQGDLSVNIAKVAKRTAAVDGPQSLYDLFGAQGNLVYRVMESSMDALDTNDCEIAQKLVKLDEPIDNMYKQLLSELARLQDEETVEWANQIALASRHLERVADNAVTIGERIGYVVTGQWDTTSDTDGVK
jgi:phosphate transport system protein